MYVYDITKKNSFKNLENWIELVNQNNKNSACNFIIGNKKDLNNLREIGLKEGKDYAFSKKFNFMETSAKNNDNIDIDIENVCENIFDTVKENQISSKDKSKKTRKKRKYVINE